MSRLLEEFKEYLKEMNQYDHVTGLLQWDMQTTVPNEAWAGGACGCADLFFHEEL